MGKVVVISLGGPRRRLEKHWLWFGSGAGLPVMNESEVQCPSCGEWFVIPWVAPEDYGSQMDYDCEVC